MWGSVGIGVLGSGGSHGRRGRVHGVSVVGMWEEVWESVWGECGGCGEVCYGVGGGEERELWGSVLGFRGR